ncbi:MAG: DUF1273 family protein [Clostridia bacterium]|nr:DUF1273 family protein [Clostridia bacterium]
MTEEEKRLHRCCFSGHRLEKLNEDEATVKAWLEHEITISYKRGYSTFITGCAMGVDIWAGQIVLKLRDEIRARIGHTPNIKLIAATPWPGFANRWSAEWKAQYDQLLKDADLVVNISKHYHENVFQQRNEWMVDHSSKVIAYYNGAPGGTQNTINYAEEKNVLVVTNNPEYIPPRERRKKMEREELDYPENLLKDIGLEMIFEVGQYRALTEDQLDGLNYALSTIRPREEDMIRLRYEKKYTLEETGDTHGVSKERARQIIAKGLRKLRHQSRIIFIQNGRSQTEMNLKLLCANEIKRQLELQQQLRPLMTEEDVVKFVFQGMLGVGHLISSEQEARERLASEMEPLQYDGSERLLEKISTEWVRINLRQAKQMGFSPDLLAWLLVRSTEEKGLSFTRQNVYNFCVKYDGSDKMKAAAEKVLDENWLPSHSEQYRNAYHPAYRVLHKDYRNFKRDEEE